MKSRLIIRKSACELGINNACAAVIEDITVSDDQSFVGVLQSNLNHVASRLNELDSNIVYEGFARQLKKLGYENTVSANEKLLRRFIAKGVYPINNIVDAYNAVAIRHGVSIGVHTYHQKDDIYVMRSDKPRVLRPLFAKKAITIPVGDIVYTCGDVPLASIGKVDADAHVAEHAVERGAGRGLGRGEVRRDHAGHLRRPGRRRVVRDVVGRGGAALVGLGLADLRG